MSATKVRQQNVPPVEPAAELDRTDRAILRQLQRDASLSNVALAAKVHLSPPACLRRVERLRRLGLIDKVVALLSPRAVGAGMLVMIGVVLDRSTPDSFAAFEKAAAKVSGCMECHVVTGEFDYFMLVRTRDNDSFNRLHAEQLLYLPGCGRCGRSWCCAMCCPPLSCRWRCDPQAAGRTRLLSSDHTGPPNTFTTSPAINSPAPAKCTGCSASPNTSQPVVSPTTGTSRVKGATRFTG